VGFFSKKDGKKSSVRTIVAQIAVFTGLVCLTALALRPLQLALNRGMVLIRDSLIVRAENIIGREIQYSSIRPTLLGAFDIRNIRIMEEAQDGQGGEPLLSISRLRVSFSFLDLLRGKPTAIRGVQFDRPVVNLDMKRDRDILSLFSSSREEKQASGPHPLRKIVDNIPPNMDFRIRGGQFGIRDRGVLIQVQGMAFDIRTNGTENKQISMDGRWKAVLSSNIFGRSLNPFIDMSINGKFSASPEEADYAAGSAVITLSSAKSQINFDLNLDSRNLNISNREKQPFDFNFDYYLQTGGIVAHFHCSDLRLADIVSFSGSWKPANQWLNQIASGDAVFERDGGKQRYSIDVSGKNPNTSDSFTIRGNGNEKLAVVEEFHLSASPIISRDTAKKEDVTLFQGMMGFRGNIGFAPFAPNGTISFRNVSLTGTESLSGEFGVSARGREISVSGKTVTMGQTVLDVLNIALTPGQEELGVSVFASGGQKQGTISLNASMAYYPRKLDGGISFNSFSASALVGILQPFVRQAKVPPFAQGLTQGTAITAKISFSTDYRHFSIYSPRFVVAQNTENVGLFTVSATDQSLKISDGRFGGKDNIFLVSVNANYSNPQRIDFSLTAGYRDLSWLLEGSLRDRKTLNIKGSHGINANITMSNSGAFSGKIEAPEFPIPIRGQAAYVSFNSSVRYNSKDSWSVNLDRLEVRDISGPAGPGRLLISGSADQKGVRFPLVNYSDAIGPLNGGADFSWSRDLSELKGTFSVSDGPDRKENYVIGCSFREKRFELQGSVSGMRLGRLFKNAGQAGQAGLAQQARANGEIKAFWDPLNSYRAEFRLTSLDARIKGNGIQASAVAVLDPAEFAIRDLTVDVAGLKAEMPWLRISRAGSFAVAVVNVSGHIREKTAQGDFILNAGFDPIDSWLQINRALKQVSGSIQVVNLQYAEAKNKEPFNFKFVRNDGEISVSGGPKDMLRLQMDRKGNFYAGLSSPFPVRGSAVGSIKDNYIDLHCSDIYVDLAGLWAMVPPVRNFALTGGYASARLDIRGPLRDPEFFGSARGNSVRIQVPGYIAQDIRPVPFNVAIEGNEMRFGPVQAAVGKGSGTVSGWFRFDRWRPNVFNVEIQVPKESPIPFDYNITAFLAQGDVSGRLVLSMEDQTFDISGAILANNTEMGLNTDAIPNSQAGRELFSNVKRPITAKISVTTGSTVEFIWPNSKTPVLRAAPAMGTVAHVTVDTQARQYSLNSDIKIRGGELFYFERSFFIRSGTLVLRENEQGFNPRLTARAEIRERTDTGPVTISLIVNNEPLRTFVPRFESSPSLSQVEIFALLGQNLGIGEGDSDSMQRFFLTSTTDLLSQFVVGRQMEREIRNLLGLDMFSVRTQVLQNAVLSVANLGQNPVDRNYRVGNYFNNTTIFGGKYIGTDMFIQGMLSMRYDENQTAFGGLRLEPDIGIELQSPLFNIRWNFVPAHPENWWVSDNSITLTWSKSF